MTEPGPGPDPDGVDRLLLAEAAAYAGRRTVVVDDVTGALVGGLAGVYRWFCDSLVDERTVALAASSLPPSPWLDDALLGGAQLVVARLPKSLAALDELAGAVAAYAEPDVVLLAGGLVRHLSRGMNDELAGHFGQVRATLGRFKARALVAEGPTGAAGRTAPAAGGWARRAHHQDEGPTGCAPRGGVAGGGDRVGAPG